MATKRDPRVYKWFTYNGRNLKLETDEHELSLTKGEVFGLKKAGSRYHFVDMDRDVQMPVETFDAERMIKNSSGYAGRIGNYKVVPGVGGSDVPRQENEVHIDSTMFKQGYYDKVKKTLTLEFRSGAVWQYENVSPKEALLFETSKSQGRYYNDKIKDVKTGQRLQSLSSNAPIVYREYELPSLNEQPMLQSAFSIGESVMVAFGLSGFLAFSDNVARGCVIAGIHFYEGKVAYDVYVPVEKTVDGVLYTLLTNIDSVAINPPIDSMSSNYTLQAVVQNISKKFEASVVDRTDVGEMIEVTIHTTPETHASVRATILRTMFTAHFKLDHQPGYEGVKYAWFIFNDNRAVLTDHIDKFVLLLYNGDETDEIPEAIKKLAL